MQYATILQYMLYCTMTFVILHTDCDPAFQPMADAHVVYVYVILLFFLAVLQSCRAVAICPTGMKTTLGAMPCRSVLLSKIRLITVSLKISQNMNQK